ncbi:MAG: hypothetical protein II135_05780 [Clostridia bacterium]|nr:hypothetical protein [Clostridia bacterium]MBQ3868932.1 hypothetical protein [Clostridia bacterium]
MGAFRFRWTSLFFYVGLVAVVAVAILGIIKLQEPVTDWLSDYENSMSKYKVQEIFDEYFKDPDAEKLISMCEKKPEYNAPDTFETAVDRFELRFKGKEISYGYAAGTERKKIIVKADGVKFATFSIKEKEERSKYGRTLYELDGIDLFYDQPTESGKVKVPFSYTVYANGMELDETYLIEENIKEDPRDYVPDGAYFFTYKRYEIGGLYGKPVFTAKDGSGVEVPLSFDITTGEYGCRFEYSEELKDRYGEYVTEAMHGYAVYMQNDARFKTIKQYFDPDSELYQNIYENPGSFVWEHDGYRFGETELSEFFDYGGVISCRIAFDHILEKKKSEDYIDRIDLTVYLHECGGEYKIFYMVTN